MLTPALSYPMGEGARFVRRSSPSDGGKAGAGKPGRFIPDEQFGRNRRLSMLVPALGLAGLLIVAGAGLAATAQAASGLPPAAIKHWTADNGNGTYSNPLFYSEFEDPDMIRVGDDYYLVGTTMHMNPALEILHSKDLVNWEHAGYCMDRLDFGPAFRLEGGNIYGQGIWAALHPSSPGNVLHPLEHERRGPPGLPFQVNQRSLGSATNCRAERPVRAVR